MASNRSFTVEVNPLSAEPETYEFDQLSTAVRRYARMLRRHPTAHVRLTNTGTLPGIEPGIIAEEFGHERHHHPLHQHR